MGAIARRQPYVPISSLAAVPRRRPPPRPGGGPARDRGFPAARPTAVRPGPQRRAVVRQRRHLRPRQPRRSGATRDRWPDLRLCRRVHQGRHAADLPPSDGRHGRILGREAGDVRRRHRRLQPRRADGAADCARLVGHRPRQRIRGLHLGRSRDEAVAVRREPPPARRTSGAPGWQPSDVRELPELSPADRRRDRVPRPDHGWRTESRRSIRHLRHPPRRQGSPHDHPDGRQSRRRATSSRSRRRTDATSPTRGGIESSAGSASISSTSERARLGP